MTEIENIEKLINDKEVQFRSFSLNKVEKRQLDDGTEELVVEGVAAVTNQLTVLYKGKYYEDREIITSEAFANSDLSDVIFNFNHCGRVYARTRNNSLELWLEGDGLHMRAHLRASDNGHQELYADIQSGLLDKMSFAFHVSEAHWESYEDEASEYVIYTRYVTGIDKVYDVSVVDIPAYDTTSISARSAFDAERERRNAESIKHQAEHEEAVRLAKAKYLYGGN